ncbi:MAG: TerB family tellurite resistance protein [Gammaproteobacteria bacterium]|nr:TerB family tellurite resistance protein [Gammaproteobacteria bacterium]MDH3768477.1 TerB family tellurite resistance protein [Gammaproteobacteria bacterium]
MTDFNTLRSVFAKGAPTDIEQKQLLTEVALVTLARATSADANIHPVEIETVQKSLKEITGEEFSGADIRLAASSALFETAPLGKYLNRAARRLDSDDRVLIAQALEKVIRSDVRISPFESEFFDMVTNALRLSPSQLVGLKPV